MKLHRSGDSSVNGWSLLLEDDGDPPEPQVLNLAGSSSSFLRHEELMNTQYIGPVRR
ncbi:hypothetical protein DY000_02043823 [Brassica cretica]|uniref:Uncharacterized protein n=1 Tax=Brassica cretica TaxID=69181 RepID=A0ABQ7BKZ5_BRACR|nr:hypothetical protein DY000_02043823 [Brassica cretica]